ncbi:MAG: ybiB [Geminicoccaceae bacterium]|nr:ybiB [Geminicoccaceae bacterium]
MTCATATRLRAGGDWLRAEPAFAEPHPFAGFLRTIGRGATLGRPLGEAEAEQAMAMILDGAVEPVQLGAFLLVLRYRTETPAELAGFVRAARRRIAKPDGIAVDLDWPSYADRHKQLPYFLLAALLLAGSGVRVLVHGIAGEGAATTPAVLSVLGVPACRSAIEAADRLSNFGFAYLPLRAICPELEALFHLRPLLGLRSPANSLARELNPLGASHQIQGVFHPTYLPLHQQTAQRLGQAHAVIFKGGGGEGQRNPDKPCRTLTVDDGVPGETIWPALAESDQHPWRKEPLEPERLAALWRGEWEAPGPIAAVVGTAAMALKLLGRAVSIEKAEAEARRLWAERPRDTYPA